MISDIPQAFDDDFLDWFRTRTEATWSSNKALGFDAYVAAHRGGTDWQRGTRWLGGLSAAQVEETERHWSIRFPPDYRRFLTQLHTVDRPMRGAAFVGVDGAQGDTHASRLVPIVRPSFYNWLTDENALRRQWDWLVEGLMFDVEHANLWLKSWGPKPPTPEAQHAQLVALVAAAPRLIPVYAHRYLLAEPWVQGNPVFSIYQSDIIVYGPNLRSYLLVEFADLLDLNIRGQAIRDEVEVLTNTRYSEYLAIPFWGELLAGDWDE